MTESILDTPAVSGRYLFPQGRTIREPFRVPVNGAELACYHRVISPDALTVIHFHGNGEAVADYVPWLADELAAFGCNTLCVEYRDYGASTGQAHLVAMLGDGTAVLAAAGVPANRAVAFGRSIGSLYALEMARRHLDLAGLIVESGIAAPLERLLLYADLQATNITPSALAEEVARHFDHQQKLAGYTNPLLLLHAEHDHLVDITHAERNFAWSASPQKLLVRFPFGDHNTILAANRPAYLTAVREFLAGCGAR